MFRASHSHCPVPNIAVISMFIFNNRDIKHRAEELWENAIGKPHTFISTDKNDIENELMAALAPIFSDEGDYRENSLSLYGDIIVHPLLTISDPFVCLKIELMAYLFMRFGEQHKVKVVKSAVEVAVNPYMNAKQFHHSVIYLHVDDMFDTAAEHLSHQ